MSYTTIQGDVWDMISYKVYGDEAHISNLIAANYRHKDTAVFPAGVELTIPELPPEARYAELLPPWKRK